MRTLEQWVAEAAPDPADAERRLARIAAASAIDLATLGPDGREVLRLACQRAPYLATLLTRDGERLGRIAGDPYLRRQKPRAVMAAELAARAAGVAEPAELARALRRYRADELVRLGARELGLGSPVEVGVELAHLAEVCLDRAIAFHRAALTARHGAPWFEGDGGAPRPAEFCVIGMGKLGGAELNFASDIDLIYVYSSDAGAVGELSLHDWFARLAERVTQSLSETTEDDVVFKVDLRLRPEGSRGPIANSLPSLERYYESFGRPWERQAWLKARPCAGDPALGAEVMALMAPFIHPRHTSPAIIAEVAALNRRIKAELDRGELERGIDLKNGVGGIREIEFFVQALQLIHAGPSPRLRARGTLAALDQLLFAGLINEAEQRALSQAYRYLRRLEHLLQLDSGRQTQRLPGDAAELERFARRAGHTDAAELGRVLAEHTARVARLFATLGEEDGALPHEVHALLAAEHEADAEEALLATLGFREPAAARHHLERARRRATSPFGRAAEGAAQRIAPLLFTEVARSPDPDQALRHVTELCERFGAFSALWRMMDENPALRRLVASVFGTSEYLARHLTQHPEQFEALLAAGRASARASRGELDALIAARFAEHADAEARWSALAELKTGEVVRIGLADVAGELDAEAVGHQLSELAEACVAAAWPLVTGPMLERHGVVRDAGGAEISMAVLALGKLGGRELGHGSDLDLIFVYGGAGDSDGPRPLDGVTYMTRLAQRLVSGLAARHEGGRLYEIDTRLRPSGSQGLLVSSLEAWRRYHREDARLWERQALTRLRPVAGDPALGREVAAIAGEFAYGHDGRPQAAAIAEGVRAMRDKMERELARGARDVKVGRGGLVDIEFAAQFLQLVHGHAHPSLRTPSTIEALRAAAVALPELGPACTLLVDGYRFLRTLENRLRIVHDRAVHRLPDDPIELGKLARRAGYETGAELVAIYHRWTETVRATFQQIVAPAP